MKTRRVSRFVMLALMMLASTSAAAQYVECTASNVRLRTGPSTQYPMLVWNATNKPVYINKGETLTYLGNDTPEFYNVQFDGKSVYISKKFARLVNNNAKSNDGKLVVVNGDNVRLRWGPSLTAKIYTDSKGRPVYPKKGTQLGYGGEVGDWYKVLYGNHVLYISKKHCLLR